ncbi:MAG: hypothetical protein K8T26_09795 [Lentisphaerae bacterium]|nr:hypothetical protein [Lentisphaerota bacterium]
MSNVSAALSEACHRLDAWHGRTRASLRAIPPVVSCLLLLTPTAGCRVVQTAVDAPAQAIRAVTPGQTGTPPVDPVDVQQTLLRFTDEFTSRANAGIDQLQRGTNALSRADVLMWKISLGTEACSIASGPNPVVNLLDMTIFVTVMRLALEEHWQPKVFGDSGLPLLDSCRQAEAEIWRLASKVLTPEQQAELRQAITDWHGQNPLPDGVLAPRAVGFAPELAKASKTSSIRLGSVFELLKVDPLASLDPAVRELAQTRLFAERALFVTQRMPMLLSWQTELLSINLMGQATVQQLLTNTTQLTTSVERFARVAEQLPPQLSTEREEIVKALQSQEAELTPLVSEVRQALVAGSQMSTSLTTTITTFDALMERFGVGDTTNAAPPETNAAPFRIQDYTASAAQMEATARQLTELLLTLDRTIGSTNVSQLAAQVGPVVQQAQSGGKDVVDHAFWRGALLVLIALAAALAYRYLAGRMAAR